MKKILKYTKLISGTLLVGGLLFSSCTDQFEKWNINPNEVTPGQMDQDNLNTGAYFTQMEKGVFIVGKDLGGEYQITEMLTGDIFASYIANINTYSYTTYHNDHYALYKDWYGAPFKDAYTYIMQPWKSIVDVTDQGSVSRAMATVIKVLGMSRITDMYGPIPYSKFGTSTQVPYDSQKDVYYQFFDELDDAINVLTAYSNSNSAKYMEQYDYIYSGNVSKWIKFANTLRLRLAMRISFVDKTKAQTEATAAINHSSGLMTSSDDSAFLHQTTSFTFTNPIWEVSESFKDMRMGATMDCYLNGYGDPRISRYFRTAAKDGKYHGVRNGMTNLAKDTYVAAASGLNFETNSSMQWMDAAEAYFLLAEAKLRLNLGTGTVQSYYEQGIRTSFASKGASGVDTYITNATNLPLSTYTNPVTNAGTNVGSSLSLRTIAWSEGASAEEKLERIMIQKWIALYPDGQEAWSEMRRTGYPGFVRINSYNYTTEVASGELISRLKFPTTEYSNNSQNTQAAVSLLGGSDIAGTKLWWDVR
ncbi:SusD/RagB family nutrient-binding outer membrane lipoprotein [Dysgonomonas sp. BGC7]|uniref:SusD/RagB family nutrient-binding outer membrane lipoprotein n=1 Tax=Dysgonomonas sp. BGC7 TaxID=1658008 RepID=UPI0006831FF1|nr:SusD/RagB family nutrient-binding outer membrane lipoprotein [Dysgonomonas sp. BGC7]MBD8388448.1 SusD/RagB family nutrient-binding outer membrane lipoprotein [Dysgonomonas sp. BGC7]